MLIKVLTIFEFEKYPRLTVRNNFAKFTPWNGRDTLGF